MRIPGLHPARHGTLSQELTSRAAPAVDVRPLVSLLDMRTGAELTWTKLAALRDQVLELVAGDVAGVVLVLGTDTLDEVRARGGCRCRCSCTALGSSISDACPHATARPPLRCTCCWRHACGSCANAW